MDSHWLKTLVDVGLLAAFGAGGCLIAVCLAPVGDFVRERCYCSFFLQRLEFMLTIVRLYSYFGYVAFIVGWTRNEIASTPAYPIILWPVSFLAAWLVACVYSGTGYEKWRTCNQEQDIIYLGPIAFLVFALAPSVMKLGWPWVPFVR